jgi:hypothetical protein
VAIVVKIARRSVSLKDMQMKYHVTYRLFHPQYLPALSVAAMEASSHAELEGKLAKIKTKWQARGYRVQITHIRQQKATKRKHRP